MNSQVSMISQVDLNLTKFVSPSGIKFSFGILRLQCLGCQKHKVLQQFTILSWSYQTGYFSRPCVSDDGYYEDMYPAVEQRPTYRPETVISLDLLSEQEMDDEVALEEAEQFIKQHQITPNKHYLNLAFQQVQTLV